MSKMRAMTELWDGICRKKYNVKESKLRSSNPHKKESIRGKGGRKSSSFPKTGRKKKMSRRL